MTTASAITGVTGQLLIGGEFDRSNPPSVDKSWWGGGYDAQKPVKFKYIKLGDLITDNGWNLLASVVAKDGIGMRDVVEYGIPEGSTERQIRTAKNLYIKRGSIYKVVAL